jgi:alanine dehydrogenase
MVIIGVGIVGINAAKIALCMGVQVTELDNRRWPILSESPASASQNDSIEPNF